MTEQKQMTQRELDILANALTSYKYNVVAKYRKNGPPMTMAELETYKVQIEEIESIDKLIEDFKIV